MKKIAINWDNPNVTSLSVEEKNYLKNLERAVNSSDGMKKVGQLFDDGHDEGMDDILLQKEALWGKLKELGNVMKDNQQAITTGLLLSSMLPLAVVGTKSLASPITGSIAKKYRYKRMMDLPGGSPEVRADNQGVFDEWFVERRNLSEEDANEELRRKVFSMMHRYAPNLTKDPTMAKFMMNTGVSADPRTFLETITSLEDATSRVRRGERASALQDSSLLSSLRVPTGEFGNAMRSMDSSPAPTPTATVTAPAPQWTST